MTTLSPGITTLPYFQHSYVEHDNEFRLGGGVIPIRSTPTNILEKWITVSGAITGSASVIYTTAGNKHYPRGTAGQGLPWALQEFDWRQHNANISDT